MERKGLLKVYFHYFILFIILNIFNKISIATIKGGVAIAIAIVWMILSIALYFVYIRKRNSTSMIMLYSILNAVLGGVAISSYYSLKVITPYRPILLIVVFGILLLANYWLTYMLNGNEALTRINILFAMIMLAISFYIWIDIYKSLGSSLIFLSVVYLCFSYALHRAIKKNLSWNSIIPFSSLLMFGGLLLAVLVILSEGDALDALDISIPESNNKKRVKV